VAHLADRLELELGTAGVGARVENLRRAGSVRRPVVTCAGDPGANIQHGDGLREQPTTRAAGWWHHIHMQTLVIYKLALDQNYYTFTLILLIKIVLCSKFP